MPNCPYCAEALPPEWQAAEDAEIYACQHCLNPMAVMKESGDTRCRILEGVADIRESATPGSVTEAVLAQVPKMIYKLPVLPEISQRVLRLVRDPEVSMSDLAKVIREDQVIALRIMKLANSVVFAGRHEIKDLNAACARLGMSVIANAVHAVANGFLYVTGDRRLQVFMRNLWRHAFATAHAAAELAAQLHVPRPETLFVAGLVHDVGKVLLLEIISDTYSGAVGELRGSRTLFYVTMRRLHPLVGLHVVRRWAMPPEFSVTTYCHDQPHLSPNPAWVTMTHVVALANAIAKAESFTVEVPDAANLAEHPSAVHLGLDEAAIQAFREDLGSKLDALLQAITPDLSA